MKQRLGSDRTNALALVATMALVMWVSEGIDSITGHHLDGYGIRPRSDEGLVGIAAAPFLHGGFDHLLSNTVPFLVMGATIALSGLARVVLVTVVVGAISGFGTWLIAPGNTDTIGASGIVFGYATYLVARGVFSRNLIHLGVGVLVGAAWGGALLGGLLPQEGISWQAHLFGAIGGLVAARMIGGRERSPVPAAAHPA